MIRLCGFKAGELILTQSSETKRIQAVYSRQQGMLLQGRQSMQGKGEHGRPGKQAGGNGFLKFPASRKAEVYTCKLTVCAAWRKLRLFLL